MTILDENSRIKEKWICCFQGKQGQQNKMWGGALCQGAAIGGPPWEPVLLFNDPSWSAVVFFFRKTVNGHVQRIFLGFASGVMIAASVWSLLIPAIEEAEASGGIGGLPARRVCFGGAVSFPAGRFLPHFHPEAHKTEGVPVHWRRTTLLVSAVTLHNIPEGMAVGYPLLWRLSTAIRDFIRRLLLWRWV